MKSKKKAEVKELIAAKMCGATYKELTEKTGLTAYKIKKIMKENSIRELFEIGDTFYPKSPYDFKNSLEANGFMTVSGETDQGIYIRIYAKSYRLGEVVNLRSLSKLLKDNSK